MRTPRPPAFAARWAALLAVAGGLLGVLAFPRYGAWPAAFASVALLSIAVDGRRARTGAWLGYLYGAAFLTPLVSWTGIYVGPVPWLILAGSFAWFFAVLGAVLPALARLAARPVWIGAAWVLEEALRDRLPFGGFPWGRLAFSQADSPLRWFAAVGGAPLLTFAVAAAGGGIAVAVLGAVQQRSMGARRTAVAGLANAVAGRRCVVSGLAVLAAVPLLGLTLGAILAPAPDRGGRTLTVAVIQGGLPDRGLQFEDRARQVLDNHVRQTVLLAGRIASGAARRPDLVIWPENSSDVDPFRDPFAYAEIDRAVRAVDAPVLVGAILQGPGRGHRRNVGILWSPTTGPGARYTKRHPVPFAEYIPLRSVAEAVSSAAKTVTQDMVAGHGNGLLRGGPVPIGDVICFEVAYDGLVHSSVAAGAQLLVVQSNNATFGRTAETYQQLAMTRLRAVETGRTVVQATTTGVSAVVGPDGAVRAASGRLFAPAVLDMSVAVRSAQTLATRLGAAPEYALATLAILGVAYVARRRRSGMIGAAEPQAAARVEQEAMVGR